MARAEERYGPIYEQYLGLPIEEVAADPEALRSGERLFASYCTVCHGSDARGVRGFPNLRDDAWLWGGDPGQIKTSIPRRAHRGDAGMEGCARRRCRGGRNGCLRALALRPNVGCREGSGREGEVRLAVRGVPRCGRRRQSRAGERPASSTTCGSTAVRTQRCVIASRTVARAGCRPTESSSASPGCTCSRPGSGACRIVDNAVRSGTGWCRPRTPWAGHGTPPWGTSRTTDGAVQRYRVAQAHATSRTRDAAMGNLSKPYPDDPAPPAPGAPPALRSRPPPPEAQ